MSSCPLIRQPAPDLFSTSLQRLHQRFRIYAATSPQPLPAPGLFITPEIRLQSELYLPINEIRRMFFRLYGQCLSYPPVLGSTLFHSSLSWADCFAGLPGWLQFSSNPAVLAERLLADAGLLTRFLFHSFLPSRFNGTGFDRYPEQHDLLLGWLPGKAGEKLAILDAACGSGEGTWELADLLQQGGRQPEQAWIEGWTLDPLEVWAAQNQALPHEPEREARYKLRVQPLLKQGWGEQVRFRVVDLLGGMPAAEGFDLILCNGLLGGPVIHQLHQLQQALSSLAGLVTPGGLLLLANRFHDGWRKKAPLDVLARLMQGMGLELLQTGEGLAGVRQRQ